MTTPLASRFLSRLALLLLVACSGKESLEREAPKPEEETPPRGMLELRASNMKVPVLQGESAEVKVQIVRRGDVAGPVRLFAKGLPEGVTMSPSTPSTEADEVALTFEARAQAPHSLPVEVELRGTAAFASGEPGEAEATIDLTVTVCGHPGALDTRGSVVTPVADGSTSDIVYALASEEIEREERLVAAGGEGSSGNFALARYSEAGELDVSFGKGGIVLTEVADATKNDVASAVLLQADDRVPTVRVLLAGSANGSNHDFAVTRYWR
jgi:hypothetical protein